MDHTQPLAGSRKLRHRLLVDAAHDTSAAHNAPAAARPPAAAPPLLWSSTAGDGLLEQTEAGPLAIAWRDRRLLLAVAAVVGALVYLLSTQMSTVFVAETTLAFPYTDSEVALQGSDAERSRTLRTEAKRVTSFGLLDQAARALGSGLDASVLEERVVALPEPDADVITVRATAPDAAEAVATADAVAAAYRRQIDWRQQNSIEDLERRAATLEERINTQQKQLAGQLQDAPVTAAGETAADSDPVVAALQIALEASVSQLSAVQERLDEVRAQRKTASGGVQVLRPAQTPTAPEQPRPARNAATAVILAVMAVATARWWRTDPEPARLRDAPTAEMLLGFPVISEIPFLRQPSGPAGIVTRRYPEIVDAYRMVAAATPSRGTVLVTPAGADGSASDLALNTAAALSGDGYRVLLVDAEPRAQRLAGERGLDHPGFSNLVLQQTTPRDCLLSGRTDGGDVVGLVPWGTGPAVLPRAARAGIADAVEQLAVSADVVLIDGPPLASSADALALAGNVDGILLAVTTDTAVSDIRRLRARLDQLDRPVLGIVVQHTSSPHRSRRRRRAATVPVRWTRPGARSTQGAGPAQA